MKKFEINESNILRGMIFDRFTNHIAEPISKDIKDVRATNDDWKFGTSFDVVYTNGEILTFTVTKK